MLTIKLIHIRAKIKNNCNKTDKIYLTKMRYVKSFGG